MGQTTVRLKHNGSPVSGSKVTLAWPGGQASKRTTSSGQVIFVGGPSTHRITVESGGVTPIPTPGWRPTNAQRRDIKSTFVWGNRSTADPTLDFTAYFPAWSASRRTSFFADCKTRGRSHVVLTAGVQYKGAGSKSWWMYRKPDQFADALERIYAAHLIPIVVPYIWEQYGRNNAAGCLAEWTRMTRDEPRLLELMNAGCVVPGFEYNSDLNPQQQADIVRGMRRLFTKTHLGISFTPKRPHGEQGKGSNPRGPIPNGWKASNGHVTMESFWRWGKREKIDFFGYQSDAYRNGSLAQYEIDLMDDIRDLTARFAKKGPKAGSAPGYAPVAGGAYKNDFVVLEMFAWSRLNGRISASHARRIAQRVQREPGVRGVGDGL